MNEPNSTKIRHSITRFRRLAIGSGVFVAILATTMIFNITSVLDDESATNINTMGMQRLLAQRTLIDALAIDTSARTGSWDQLEDLLLELETNANQLRASHNTYLTTANTQPTSQTAGSEDFDFRRYEALQGIQLPYNALNRATDELHKLTVSMIHRSPYVDPITLDRVTAAKNNIADAHALYLPGINELIAIAEERYKSEIAASIRHAKVGMLVLIVVLAANILFIVEPTILIIRRQLRDLDKAARQAKRSDAIRWRLLTNMGHEFRTPMNAIMGFADLLQTEATSETERSRLAQSICESSSKLTQLIETMLDLSAIESGQIRVNKEPCNLHNILTQIQVDSAGMILSKKLELKLCIDDSCPQIVTTDPKRLKQILANLTDNAIKFTQEGSIQIDAQMISIDNSNAIQIKVIDSGIGIDPKDHKSIFDPFTQSQDNLTRNFGGAGLGLAVSKDLAKALGGDVLVDSTVGEGSTFTLTFQAGKIQHAAETTSSQPTETATQNALFNKRILVVDDAKDNRVLMQHFLKKSQAIVEFAQDGQKAIDAVNKANTDNTPYDIILMDMQMPVLDGYNATIQLRKQGVTTSILAVTAHALEGDREHCLSAGCNEYMSKPISKANLIETCTKLVNSQSAQANQSNAA